MTLQEALNIFLIAKKIERLSQKSLDDYKDFVNLFLKYIGSEKDIYELKQQDISDYMYYQSSRNISNTTYATYIRHLKAFIHWICDNYEVSYTHKKIKVPKGEKKVVKLYSNDEIKLILDSFRCSTPWINARNRLIISLMLDSGIRQKEICNLLMKHMYLESGTMKVIGKGKKERTVPLGKMSIKLLNEYRKQLPTEFKDYEYVMVALNGEQMTENSIKQLVSRHAKLLPFELSSHKLRHNFATNYCLDMYRAKGQIDIYRLKAIMGHDKIETTEVYLHLAMEIIASLECISHMDMVYQIA